MLVKYRPTSSLLHNFFDDAWHPASEEDCEMSPRTDILERKEEYVLFAEMPGINKDDFKVDLENSVLTVRGEKKIHEKVDGENYTRVERQSGSYKRSFRLGDEINTGKISAKYENGILQVLLPKSAKSKPKSVEIKIS
jgi:HSP20 family protein